LESDRYLYSGCPRFDVRHDSQQGGKWEQSKRRAADCEFPFQIPIIITSTTNGSYYTNSLPMSFITNSNSAPTIHDVMARIRALRINFIAIDFDRTFIERKPGHAFTGSELDLPLVRPIFIELINAALQPPPPPPDPTTTVTTTKNDVIYVAIVTYNQRTHLIRSLLNIVFRNMASRIVIRGNDTSWNYKMGNGKQYHMESAVEEILHNHLASHNGTTSTATAGSPDSNDHNNVTASPATATTTTTTSSSTLEITKSTMLLIDDSRGIICTARENGIRAVWYNPDRNIDPKQLYIDLVQLE
jgi:hypothetical protein